jgi:hypothetical protein
MFGVLPIPRDFFTIDSVFPDIVSLSHLIYMDDSTLMSSSYEGMTQLLSTCQEFYFLNNTAANLSKYTLISSHSLNSDIQFSLPFTINNPTTSFTLRSLSATDSFRFLGVWFNLKVFLKFVQNQLSQEYKEISAIVRWKKLSPMQLTYIHNVVLLPKVEYRAQVTSISESLCKKLSSPFMILFKNRLGFACFAPSILFHSHLFYNCTSLYTHLMKVKLNFLYKWCNAFSSYFSPNFVLLKLLTLSYLMAFPQSCFTIDDFSKWLSSLALKTDWVFQTLVFYRQLGLMHKFLPSSKILLCFKPGTPIINCLPSTTCITPSLRSNFMVKCLLSPYTNDLLSWTDLRTLGRVPVRGNIPS